jgi:hypothetical protein
MTQAINPIARRSDRKAEPQRTMVEMAHMRIGSAAFDNNHATHRQQTWSLLTSFQPQFYAYTTAT